MSSVLRHSWSDVDRVGLGWSHRDLALHFRADNANALPGRMVCHWSCVVGSGSHEASFAGVFESLSPDIG